MKAFKLTPQEKQWVKANLHNFTNEELYKQVMANRPGDDVGATTFRMALYKAGLKKCKILRWTKKETQYLLDNYTTKGNLEIGKNLSKKNRVITKKNVEKKMRLMGLKRTREMINAIVQKHKEAGKYTAANYKRWEDAKAPEGDKRVWIFKGLPKVVIKVNGKFVHYARHRYIQLHGKPKPGHKIYHKDGDTLNVEDDNLISLPAGTVKRSKYRPHVNKYFRDKKIKKQAPEIKKEVTPSHKPQGVPVRIDRRTVVYVPPGTNVKEFIDKINNRRAII